MADREVSLDMSREAVSLAEKSLEVLVIRSSSNTGERQKRRVLKRVSVL